VIIGHLTNDETSIFTRLAPVLNVRDLAAERRFYESLGLSVTYEGEEYPDFIALGDGSIDFGIQATAAQNDPPSVLHGDSIARTRTITVSTPSGLRRHALARLPDRLAPPGGFGGPSWSTNDSLIAFPGQCAQQACVWTIPRAAAGSGKC
jgi:catechol 2,3-dioxygenase-like lactoylglutathione lyase family enzyme